MFLLSRIHHSNTLWYPCDVFIYIYNIIYKRKKTPLYLRRFQWATFCCFFIVPACRFGRRQNTAALPSGQLLNFTAATKTCPVEVSVYKVVKYQAMELQILLMLRFLSKYRTNRAIEIYLSIAVLLSMREKFELSLLKLSSNCKPENEKYFCRTFHFSFHWFFSSLRKLCSLSFKTTITIANQSIA